MAYKPEGPPAVGGGRNPGKAASIAPLGIGLAPKPRKPKKQPKSKKPRGKRGGGAGDLASLLNAIYGPQQNFLSSSISAQQGAATQQAELARARAEAYAKWYGEHVPQQIQGIYGEAAGQTADFAKGFSDGMKITQDQTAAEKNAIIAQSGAPAEAQIHPTSDASDVLYGIGGYMPASTLSKQGAAFASAAAIMPGAIRAEGGRDAAKILADAEESISKLEAELAKLLSKKAETGLKLSESRRAERVKILLERERARQRRAEKLLDARIDAAADARAAAIDARKPNTEIFGSDKAGRYILDLKTGKIQMLTPPIASASSSGGSRGGGGGSKGKGKGYTEWSTSAGIVRVFPNGKTKLLVPAGGGAGPGGAVKLSAKDKATAVSAARAGIRNGMTWEELVRDSAEWPIDQGAALRLAAREYGGVVNNGRFVYTKGGLLRLGKSGSLGFNFVRAVAIAAGFKPTGKSNLPQFIAHILANQGKGSAVPSGGGQNAAATASYGFTRGGLAAPLPGRGEAGSWGYADPEGQDGRHMAIDWFAGAGTTVVVPEGGVVIEARYDPRASGQIFGGTVKVRTPDGRVWVFRHTNPAKGVRVGMRVAPGAAVGLVAPWSGSTHSHIELWKSEGGGYHAANMLNPLTFLYGDRSA